MNKLILIASVYGFLAVALGAFSTCFSKDTLGDRVGIYETANRYHFYHTFTIFFCIFI